MALANIRVEPEEILFVFLPARVFESAYNMDSRLLRRNLTPALTLAVPGLVVSTGVIGLIVWAATPFYLAVSPLLGAILSGNKRYRSRFVFATYEDRATAIGLTSHWSLWIPPSS